MKKMNKNILKVLTMLSIMSLGLNPMLTSGVVLANELEGQEQLFSSENVRKENETIEGESLESSEVQVETAESLTSSEELPVVEEEQAIESTASSEIEQTISAEPTQVMATEEAKVQPRGGVAIDSINFPDGNFRAYILRYLDRDSDGYLSADEISRVTDLFIGSKSISDLTGIKHFTSLISLSITFNNLTEIDLSGMSSLQSVYYNGNPTENIDLRNCANLAVAFHSVNNETVYISAGMTNYIGCDKIPEHTGNIVIDLDGFYTLNPDGSKSVDLTAVISPALISVFEKKNHPGYDQISKVLTIPAGEIASQFSAGNGKWTFHTKLGNIKDFTVNFDTTGGSAVESQRVEYGNFANEPAISPTMAGYKFLGWFEDATTTTLADFSTAIMADKTFYAKWQKVHQVNFETNGGTPIAPQEVNDTALASEPTSPTKASHVFLGWYEEPEMISIADFSKPIVEEAIYYAKWQKIYQVNFESNGGTAINSQQVDEFSLAIEPDVPVKEGHIFLGWYEDFITTTTADFLAPIVTDMTFYAKWQKVHNVNFESHGGTLIDSQIVNDLTVATKPATNPTKDGYEFIGWYEDSTTTIEADFSKPIEADTVFYAKWQKMVHVNFESNGGTVVVSQQVVESTPVVKPADPTKEGFKFLGWYSDKELTTLRDFNQTVSDPLTLYAKWETVTKPNVTTINKGTSSPKITSNSKSSSSLPKTGEKMTAIFYQVGLIIVGIYFVLYYVNDKKQKDTL
ncbi:InlB B-repeat-containing protein [Vagococcus sp. BWB3-3]|uniref:InlB B-repeat-containing protein n=1 Tax=Vagococcus allomyrinae TaxID=2794353 RepID=A0A940PFP2_9ENTE|nr:InlB B-repeat-containing protein [Vagococcus allomyrinae]MBP1041993.1 InlB B-repeat-containing protein [Vagococcus allomyrinae]